MLGWLSALPLPNGLAILPAVIGRSVSNKKTQEGFVKLPGIKRRWKLCRLDCNLRVLRFYNVLLSIFLLNLYLSPLS